MKEHAEIPLLAGKQREKMNMENTELAAPCCACACGGDGHHYCHNVSSEPGKEGYSVVCEDCGMESTMFDSWDGATMAWNAMQQSLIIQKQETKQ